MVTDVNDTEQVQGLTLNFIHIINYRFRKGNLGTFTYLVFMQTLDLYVEHRHRVDLDSELGLDVMCESLFVTLLYGGPFLLERRVVSKLQQALELVQVLQPDFLLDLQGFRDQVAKKWVALTDFVNEEIQCIGIPSTWSNQRRGVTGKNDGCFAKKVYRAFTHCR